MNKNDLLEAIEQKVQRRLNSASLVYFKHSWKFSSGKLKNILRALVSDHLFENNVKVFDCQTIKKQHKLKLNNMLTQQQYLASLYYFYGIEQLDIDEVEKSGILGFRKKNVTKNILNRYREQINQRARHFERMQKEIPELKEIDSYIEKIWK